MSSSPRRFALGLLLVLQPAPSRTLRVHGPVSRDRLGQHSYARATSPIASADEPSGGTTLASRAAGAASAVYAFSRPHTVRGTLLACGTGVGRALIESPERLALLPALLPRAMLGVVALVLGNLFIVGINQIYDVEIDQVNKPFLPIAAGAMSPAAAWAVVCASLCGGMGLVRSLFGGLIFQLYSFGLAIGALYSVPPFHLKRFPLLAGLIIACCRGIPPPPSPGCRTPLPLLTLSPRFLLNFGVYYATREALGLGFRWSPQVSFLARFMTVYGVVIAATKDLPDVEGDRKGGIETFATRLGTGRVAAAATAMLALNYVGAIATALAAAPGVFRTTLMAGGHALAAGWLGLAWRRLEVASAASIKRFYGQIWNLFYFEYILYLFI
ncbi:hypothetical protein EMIHUDRAFT_95285 [Emiliania huxleyi CCMP1516]|uniref:Uncharacterized protein n=2 Tax=Emiliania huxleyi TaxID=2903 RepID=A0A0D3L2A0_EMIH1|nr:hypothetical protein EMIHUDRAFT_95285 [Emiliania huxleyi CCMP1516]EOD42135.1 hypothetical protein EMIHUDRAFT_95285 [Emiliania huxleyi CCMP1516]|eukprot:XP_005794564.1 hypothetical protein EMIHUDRAFT_95285 [Emiliania huxleyi CCMP1516]